MSRAMIALHGLRWFVRKPAGSPFAHHTETVLQQSYRSVNGGPIEWIDVPVVQEPSIGDLTPDLKVRG